MHEQGVGEDSAYDKNDDGSVTQNSVGRSATQSTALALT